MGLTFVEVPDSAASDLRIGWGAFDTQSSGVLGYKRYQETNGAMQAAIIRPEDPSQNALTAGRNGLPPLKHQNRNHNMRVDPAPNPMIKRLHTISGLPRSGSTLLCALLRQNPMIRASMTSPVYSLCGALLTKMSGASQFHMFFDDDRRRRILQAVFDAYYHDVPEEGVVFDTNRSWTARAALLANLYPTSKIICCVRDVGWILDSIERMLRKNPLQVSRLFNFELGLSVYARTETLMNSDTGLVGLAWSGLREAWFSEHAKRLIVIEYDKLAKDPSDMMRRLYQALELSTFAHDFGNVQYDEPDYDSLLGMPGMHSVAQRVVFREREPIIPPDLFAKYADLSFWSRPGLKNRGALVL